MKKILLASFALLAVVVIAVLIYGEVRYGFVRTGAAESHDRFVTADTSARIVVRPLMARNLFDAWIPSERKPPTWLLTRALPHEVAFIFSPNTQTGEMGVTLYINEQRFGPAIADLVNQSGIMGQYDYMRWKGEGLELEKRGALIAKGDMTMPWAVADIARRHWGIVQGIDPLEIDGTHFLEAVFDNRDGGAFALLCTLYDYGLLGQPQAPLEEEYKTFLSIASIHAYADATAEGDLQLTVTLESTPGATPGNIEGNAFYLDIAIAEIGRVLRETYGAELRGRVYDPEGTKVTGRYTIKNVSGFISALLSAR